MFKYKLKHYSNKELWQEILNREGFTPTSEVEVLSIWQQVFFRTPELRDFLRKREVTLLKAVTLKEKTSEFILGQIAENRLWQRFDVPSGLMPKVEAAKVEEKIPDKENFLKGWITKDAKETTNV